MIYKKFTEEYLAKSLIKKQGVGFDQINKLIGQANQELDVCKRILSISLKVSYTSAYTAMLYAARALMLLKGYRPIGNNQHKTVIEFVGMCVGENYRVLMQKFDTMRKKRNLLMYEPWKLNISETDAKNAIKSADEFILLIKTQIKAEDPQTEFTF